MREHTLVSKQIISHVISLTNTYLLIIATPERVLRWRGTFPMPRLHPTKFLT